MRGVATFSGGLELQEVHTAPDGTRKLLSSLLGDGSGSLVETVIPFSNVVPNNCSIASLFPLVEFRITENMSESAQAGWCP